MRAAAVAIIGLSCWAIGPAPSAGAIDFAPYVRYSTGSWPNSVAVGDVNSDGRTDVLLTTGHDRDPVNDFKLLVFAQQPDGGLGTPTRLPTHNSYPGTSSVAVGDLDGDGRNDAAVGTGAGVETYLQTAQGELAPSGPIPGSPGGSHQVVLGDFDRDGRLDIAARSPDGLFLLTRRGDGTYARSTVTSDFVDDIETGDVNSDGRPDLAGLDADSVAIFRGAGDGTFTESSVPLSPEQIGFAIEVADVTGDGLDDVVVADGIVAVHAQSASGEIQATPFLYRDAGGEAVEALDLGRDGRQDVVAPAGQRVAVSEQHPSGTLGDPEVFPVPEVGAFQEGGLALGDVNSDGWPDIVLANYVDGLIVLRQIPPTRSPDGYPRPRGATPVRVPLVPAYFPCAAPNRAHGPPLSEGACAPAYQASGWLTVGTPEANGMAARSSGFVLLKLMGGDPATQADEADVRLSASLADVRRQADLSDYTGELWTSTTVRITDHDDEALTMQDFPLGFTVPCAATADPSTGAACELTTTVDALLGKPGAVRESRLAVWELEQVRVYDGGTDEYGVTTDDNMLFQTQGLFLP